MVFEGYHTVKSTTIHGHKANTVLQAAPVGLELFSGQFDKHLSGTEHVAKFSMSGTIDWKSLFVLQEQRNERELLQIWVDTFTSWIQRLQHKNYLSAWLKGIDRPSKTDKSNRQPSDYTWPSTAHTVAQPSLRHTAITQQPPNIGVQLALSGLKPGHGEGAVQC